MITQIEEVKIKALAEYLGEDTENISQSSYDECTFEVGSREYLVMTDSEADGRAANYIKESVWAFNASFLASYTGLPEEIFAALQPKCESANEAILRVIEGAEGGLEGFIKKAISYDGRGHFLNTYDGEEDEAGDFYVCRIN